MKSKFYLLPLHGSEHAAKEKKRLGKAMNRNKRTVTMTKMQKKGEPPQSNLLGTVSRNTVGGGAEAEKLILLDRNLALNSDAAPNYKYFTHIISNTQTVSCPVWNHCKGFLWMKCWGDWSDSAIVSFLNLWEEPQRFAL